MGYIYKISNTVNNKIYIGQTSRTVEKRWNLHKRTAKNPSYLSYSYPLYQAMRKYGIDNFQIEVIEETDNKNLNEREVYWISYYDSYNKGYNMTLGGEGHYKYEDEDFLELWNQGYNAAQITEMLHCDRHTVADRLSQLVPNYSSLQKERQTPSRYSFEKEQKIRECWDKGMSSKQIQEELGINRKGIKGYLIKYKNFSEEEWEKRNYIQRKNSNPQKIAIRQLTLDGQEVAIHQSIADAGRAVGDARRGANIRACLIGKQITAYGYKWQYADKEN